MEDAKIDPLNAGDTIPISNGALKNQEAMIQEVENDATDPTKPVLPFTREDQKCHPLKILNGGSWLGWISHATLVHPLLHLVHHRSILLQHSLHLIGNCSVLMHHFHHIAHHTLSHFRGV